MRRGGKRWISEPICVEVVWLILSVGDQLKGLDVRPWQCWVLNSESARDNAVDDGITGNWGWLWGAGLLETLGAGLVCHSGVGESIFAGKKRQRCVPKWDTGLVELTSRTRDVCVLKYWGTLICRLREGMWRKCESYMEGAYKLH